MTGSAALSVYLTAFFASVGVEGFIRFATQTRVVASSAASETLGVAGKRLLVASVVVVAVHRQTSVGGSVEVPFLSGVASETVSVSGASRAVVVGARQTHCFAG